MRGVRFVWMIAATLCLITGPGDAECRRETGYAVPSLAECNALRQAYDVHVRETISATRAKVTFFHVQCVRGPNL